MSAGVLSNFQYPAIFQSEFSVLPRKISENLRADSPSDANSREIRVLYKLLNIKHLHTRYIFLSCKTHYFSTWYGPFHGLKRAISHPKTDLTGGWNRHYQNAERIIRHSATGYVEWQQGGNRLSWHHIWHSLTSLLRFYFVKKKSRKSVSPPSKFSFKKPKWGIIRHVGNMRLSRGEDLLVMVTWICCYADRCAAAVHNAAHCPLCSLHSAIPHV